MITDNTANLPTMLAMGTASSTYNANELFNGYQGGLANLRRVKNNVFKDVEAAIQLQEKENEVSRRIVKVLIADPNENIPLEDCLLYSGEEKLTDATDQELFFELDIKSLLETHNAKRVKLFDKKVKDRVEYLEPAKVRDLKMVVVTVATL